MRSIRFALTAVLLLAGASARAGHPVPCNYNPVIVAPDTVNSLSENNYATFTANTTPAFAQWSITNGTGTVTLATSRYMYFNAGRYAPTWLQISLVVGNGQGCTDTVYKDVRIVHPCIVTPLARYISMSYAGGTVEVEVQSDCQWNVVIPTSPSWFRMLTGGTTFNGNATLVFQFDPVPLTVPYVSPGRRNTPVYIGDKDVYAYQEGWAAVGVDYNRDAKADLLWRNIANGITWVQPMNGLTAGAGSTIAGASAPPFYASEWRIVGANTASNNWWTIYWRNFVTSDNHRQIVKVTSTEYATGIVTDNANWRVVGAGTFAGASEGILRRNFSTGEVVYHTGGSGARHWFEPDPNWKIVAVDDFDGSYDDEVLWRHAVTGTVFMTRDVSTGHVIHYEPNLDWQIAATGDVNGDDKADIVWRNMADGRVWVQAIDGFRTRPGAVVWRDSDPNWQIQGLADFDGNGSKDLLWRNSSTGVVFVVLLNRDFTVNASGVVHVEPNQNWKIVAPTTSEKSTNGHH